MSTATNNPGPVTGIVAITPSDTTNIGSARGFHVTVAGNIKITTEDGQTPTIPVLASIPYPYACTVIWSTGTTATGIFALY